MAEFAPVRPATILVVEDDALVQQDLASWLADLGLTVLTANNADEGHSLLDTHAEIELLLTDIRMPGSMDGVGLAHHAAGRWPPVKITVLSGALRPEISVLPPDCIFVAKPFQRQELWHALFEVAARSTSRAIGRRHNVGGRDGSSYGIVLDYRHLVVDD